MNFNIEEMLRSKQALRQRLTSLPIVEKLHLLDALRERALDIRSAVIQQSVKVEESADYGYPEEKKQ